MAKIGFVSLGCPKALVDSEQVEEIYATDDQIQRLLRGALGG